MVVGMTGAHVHDGLQLGRVRHEQGNVQQALGHRLLGGISGVVEASGGFPGGVLDSVFMGTD